jgi:hypothetical protein
MSGILFRTESNKIHKIAVNQSVWFNIPFLCVWCLAKIYHATQVDGMMIALKLGNKTQLMDLVWIVNMI